MIIADMMVRLHMSGQYRLVHSLHMLLVALPLGHIPHMVPAATHGAEQGSASAQSATQQAA